MSSWGQDGALSSEYPAFLPPSMLGYGRNVSAMRPAEYPVHGTCGCYLRTSLVFFDCIFRADVPIAM